MLPVKYLNKYVGASNQNFKLSFLTEILIFIINFGKLNLYINIFARELIYLLTHDIISVHCILHPLSVQWAKYLLQSSAFSEYSRRKMAVSI